MPPANGNLISDEYVATIDSIAVGLSSGKLVRQEPADTTPRTSEAIRATKIVMLLEDVASGGTGQAAILRRDPSNTITDVAMRGRVLGGTFTLKWTTPDGDELETTPIAHDAEAAGVQAALEQLVELPGGTTINPGDVLVRLGKMIREGATYNLGRWLIEFIGQYAGQTVNVVVPDGDGLEGVPNAISGTRTDLADTGLTVTVRSVLPVGSPTPQKAGTVCLATWIRTFGLVISSLECRDFETS